MGEKTEPGGQCQDCAALGGDHLCNACAERRMKPWMIRVTRAMEAAGPEAPE